MTRICEHKAFAVHHEIRRLSAAEGEPVTVIVFAGDVTCYECGMAFEPFRVKLVPLIGQGANALMRTH